VHVEDQVRCATVEVGDFDQSSAGAVRDEGTRGGEVGAGKENLVASGTGLTDGGDGGLDGGSPCVDVEIVLRRVLVYLERLSQSQVNVPARSSGQMRSCCCPCTWPQFATKDSRTGR
jgi:hypothetical protein